VLGCDFGAVGAVDVDVAVFVAGQGEAVFFESVVAVACGAAVTGPGLAAGFGEACQMVDFAAPGRQIAAGPETSLEHHLQHLTQRAVEEPACSADIDGHAGGIDDDSAHPPVDRGRGDDRTLPVAAAAVVKISDRASARR